MESQLFKATQILISAFLVISPIRLLFKCRQFTIITSWKVLMPMMIQFMCCEFIWQEMKRLMSTIVIRKLANILIIDRFSHSLS